MAKFKCARCGEICGSPAWARDHCKPSRVAKRTGYRKDSARHREARMKVPARRRKQIALAGGRATAKKYVDTKQHAV